MDKFYITDGHAYSPERVLKIKDGARKPGLEILSSLNRLKKRIAIQLTTLAGLDWTSLFKKEKTLDDYPNIDQLVTDHINDFWSNYDLKLQYDLEHKRENIATKLFYTKRANYSLLTIDGKVAHKHRGMSYNQDQDQVTADTPINFYEEPMYYIIADCVFKNRKTVLKTNLTHPEQRITKLSDYLESKRKFGALAEEGGVTIIHPGYTTTYQKKFKLTNQDLPVLNRSEWGKLKSNEKDYAEMLALGRPIMEVFKKRLDDHKKLFGRKDL